MDRVAPDFAVVAETEFWPNLFGECRRRNIPLLLVNVRVSRTSLRGYMRVPRASHAMLANADVLCAQTRGDAEQLADLGVSKHLIHITGNLKFDVPVPDEPFPRVTRRAETQRVIAAIMGDEPGTADQGRLADAAKEIHGH